MKIKDWLAGEQAYKMDQNALTGAVLIISKIGDFGEASRTTLIVLQLQQSLDGC